MPDQLGGPHDPAEVIADFAQRGRPSTSARFLADQQRSNTLAVVAMQAAGLAQQHHHHQQEMAEQRRQTEIAREHADAQLRFMWSQYLQSPSGQQYRKWEAAADTASTVWEAYQGAWARAWDRALTEAQDPLPVRCLGAEHQERRRAETSPAFFLIRAALTHGTWILASVAFVCAVALFNLRNGTTADDLLRSVFGWSVLGTPAAAASAALVFLYGKQVLDPRARVGIHADIAAELDRRRDLRIAQFGEPVIEESYQSSGSPTARLVADWQADAPNGGDFTGRVNRLKREAFTTYPDADTLPWWAADIALKRSPSHRLPAECLEVLRVITSGTPETGPQLAAHLREVAALPSCGTS